MLRITVGEHELFDDNTNKFIHVPGVVVEFEHSLASLSKWESKHQKPFLGKGERTTDEILDYIRFMVISPGVNSDIVSELTQENLNAITDYIGSKESATTFGTLPQRRGSGETITAELIYYWMVAFNIPFDREHWHLNRLFNLIRICNLKQQKPKKMAPSEIAAQYREENAKRKAQLGTRG